jgi:hypothetical protein
MLSLQCSYSHGKENKMLFSDQDLMRAEKFPPSAFIFYCLLPMELSLAGDCCPSGGWLLPL